MFRILFCITCCNTPPKSRPATVRKKSVPSVGDQQQDDKLAGAGDLKNAPLSLNEKDQLLNNQIRANFDTFGAGKGDQTQGRLLNNTPEQGETAQNIHDEEFDERDVDQSERIAVETAASSAKSRQERSLEMSEYYSREMNFHGEQSASPLSSIDVDEYKEMPSDEEEAKVEVQERASAKALSKSQSPANLAASKQPSAYKNIPSTTKIGDYARLEYSPVDDLESVTTISQSRPGSERGIATRRSSGLESFSQSDQQRGPEADAAAAAADERRSLSQKSSHGVESTSISITSQLSHEQLQQNLTNMLELANSPSTFGTIGLPLGPPLATTNSETAKTSPETTGAALTSASQDSLSGSSMTSAPTSLAVTVGSASQSNTGAALVGNSIEQSFDEDMVQSGQLPAAGLERKSLTSKPNTIERVESPLSMETTTSGGLTNPTPTPSEMSGGSQSKKKKFKAKSLLKKFKRSSKRTKSDDK